MAWHHLTDAQWKRIKPHLPRPSPKPKGGRPPASDRQCFEGILWILWTGAPWSELPRQYGSGTTCWRRLKQWEENGALLRLWRAFLAELDDRNRLKWDECFVDGSFAPAKKEGAKIGKTKCGKGTKWMVLVDGKGTPLGAHLDSASPSEMKLLAKTLATVPGKPKRLVADKGYDSNALRQMLV